MKLVNSSQQLTIFEKNSIIYVQLDSKYGFDITSFILSLEFSRIERPSRKSETISECCDSKVNQNYSNKGAEDPRFPPSFKFDESKDNYSLKSSRKNWFEYYLYYQNPSKRFASGGFNNKNGNKYREHHPIRFPCALVKHKLRVTSYKLKVETQKSEFKSTSYEFKSKSSSSRVRSSSPRVTSSNSRIRVQIHM